MMSDARDGIVRVAWRMRNPGVIARMQSWLPRWLWWDFEIRGGGGRCTVSMQVGTILDMGGERAPETRYLQTGIRPSQWLYMSMLWGSIRCMGTKQEALICMLGWASATLGRECMKNSKDIRSSRVRRYPHKHHILHDLIPIINTVRS
jgi:hypothetical protein